MRAALVAILGVAALLRCAALDFGAGVKDPRPDEPAVVMTLGAIDAGQLFPMHMAYGGGYFYPLYAFVKPWSWWAWPEGLRARVAEHPEEVRVVARTWSALLSALTVWLTYVIGRRLGGAPGGLLAAAFLACSTLAIREAHFAKSDSAAALAFALVLLAVTHSWSSPGWRALAIGAAGGFALSTKYLVGLLPVIVLSLASGWRSQGYRIDRRSLVTGGATLAVVVVAFNLPWIVWPTEAWTYMRAILGSQWAYTQQPWLADALVSPLRYHATISLPSGCGILFAALALPAVALGLWRPGPSRLIGLAVLGHFAVVLLNPLVLARNLLPCVPGLAVLIGSLVAEVGLRVGRTRGQRAVAVGLAGLAIAAQPLLNGVQLVRLLATPDTRALAAEWIREHVPAEAGIVSWGAPTWAVDFGMPPVQGYTLFRRLAPSEWRARGISVVVWHHHPLPFCREALPPSTPALDSLAVFDPFDGPLDDPVFERHDAFYLPLAGFNGIRRPGPRIEIFALRAG